MPEWIQDPYIVLGGLFGLLFLLMLAASLFGFDKVATAIGNLLDRFRPGPR